MTEDGVRAAFQKGSAAAALWVHLMRLNDPRAASGYCGRPAAILVQGGRRAYRMLPWVEPPPAAIPNGSLTPLGH